MEFKNLNTVKFQQKMKPAALRIYQAVFPGCDLEDLRGEGVRVHILDKEFGIDSLINLPSQQWITLQEKYRRHDAMCYMDFTQEYMNGVGTPYESPGEWFKLGAQLYFYGWANADETAFEKWLLMDIAKYKILVERAGGIDKLGKIRQNNLHGRASFYAIPVKKLESCFITDYRWVKIPTHETAPAEKDAQMTLFDCTPTATEAGL